MKITKQMIYELQLNKEQRSRLFRLMKNAAEYRNLLMLELYVTYKSTKKIIYPSYSGFLPELDLPANYKDCCHKSTIDQFRRELKDILKTSKRFPYFRSNRALSIRARGCQLIKTDEDYQIKLSLYSRKYAESNTIKTFDFVDIVLPKKINAGIDTRKAILERLICGEYKQGNSLISYDDGKKKFYLRLSYSFEKENHTPGDKIMGVDMGARCLAYCAILDNPKRLSFISESDYILDRFIGYTKRRRAFGRQLYKENAAGKGHGKKRFFQKIHKLKGYFANFRKTENHKISLKIVNFAMVNSVGILVLEKLNAARDPQKLEGEESGREKARRTVIEAWSYYDLQNKIKYKAMEAGIRVEYIDPYLTSRQCHKCGNAGKDYRKTQNQFICGFCGNEEQADYNAALNIAKRYIYSNWYDCAANSYKSSLTKDDIFSQ